MSLVGPRPERPEFVAALRDRHPPLLATAHRVKSGVTAGRRSTALRGQTSLSDRVEWDNYYIEHWTLGLDFKILAMTMLVVLRPGRVTPLGWAVSPFWIWMQAIIFVCIVASIIIATIKDWCSG